MSYACHWATALEDNLRVRRAKIKKNRIKRVNMKQKNVGNIFVISLPFFIFHESAKICFFWSETQTHSEILRAHPHMFSRESKRILQVNWLARQINDSFWWPFFPFIWQNEFEKNTKKIRKVLIYLKTREGMFINILLTANRWYQMLTANLRKKNITKTNYNLKTDLRSAVNSRISSSPETN